MVFSLASPTFPTVCLGRLAQQATVDLRNTLNAVVGFSPFASSRNH